MNEVDTLRRALIQTTVDMSNERANYDAALWILTPAMLYSAATASGGISQGLKNNLVLATAALGAGYGFLNSRPKEYEQFYSQGAKQLACLMVDYSRFLYKTDEVDISSSRAVSTAPPIPAIQDFSGAQRIFLQETKLKQAILDYEKNVNKVVQSLLKTKPLPEGHGCAMPTGTDCRRRQSVLVHSPLPENIQSASEIRDITDQQLHDAKVELSNLQNLVDNIQHEAAMELRFESRQVMADIASEIQQKRPDLTKLSDAMSAVSKMLEDSNATFKDLPDKIARAQSSMKTPLDRLKARTLVLPASLDAQDAEYMRTAENNLFDGIASTRIILAAHTERIKEVKSLKSAMNCLPTKSFFEAKNKPASGNPPATTETLLSAKPTGK